MMVVCPCGSELSYERCCQPYHLGECAPTAEALMRSRFCAYATGNIDYIIKTTLPFLAARLDTEALKTWAESMTWLSLQIVSVQPKIGKRHAQVHFRATYQENSGPTGVHDELSAFVKVMHAQQARWYFLDPTVQIHLTNKQPCLCGSGEKFKQCCGKFLS